MQKVVAGLKMLGIAYLIKMAKLTQQQYDTLIKKGLNETQIANLAKQKGYDLPSATTTKERGTITNLAIGAAKGFVGDIARPTAQLLQGVGQRALAGITPGMSVADVQKQTGIASLKDETPEGQAVVQALKTDGAAQTTGRVAVNIASFFVPTAPAASVAGRSLSTAGRITTRAGIGLSSKEAPLIQAYKAKYSVPQRIWTALTGAKTSKPITNADTALRNSLFGTESMIGVQAKRAAGNIWDNMINPVLEKSTEKVNMSSFIDDIQKQVDEIPELTRKNELIEALKAFKDDYGKVGEVTMKKLQEFKEGWAKFIPDKAYKGKPIASSFREIQNMAADLARNKIYKLFPDDTGKVAYFDYGNMKNLQEMGQKAMTGSKLKGGAGSFVSGLYDKVITPIATTGGLALYKTGEGLQFVGRVGGKVLGDLFR